MKKLVDFNKGFENMRVVVSSVAEFEQLKKDNPGSDFGNLNTYVDYREKRKSNKPYVFNLANSKPAIEIMAETDKAYKIQVSFISGYINGQPNEKHFKWVAKSLCQMIEGVLYYPKFI